MLRSTLWDYSDAYILLKGAITLPNTGTAADTEMPLISCEINLFLT